MIEDLLVLSVRDNGDGFDVNALQETNGGPKRGAGLRNMRERVMAAGGELTIESAPGEGTRILATWTPGSLKLLADESVLDGVDRNR